MSEPTNRNAPCPCGSGRKYKVCCYAKDTADRADFARRHLRALEGELIPLLADYAAETFRQRDVKKAQIEFAEGWSEKQLDPSDPDIPGIFLPWLASIWTPPELSKEDDPYPRPTVASAYLVAKEGLLASDRVAFLQALIKCYPSFYQVRSTQPGKSIVLKDLLFGADAEVVEIKASKDLQPGDILYARVLTFDGATVLIGAGHAVFPPILLDRIISLRDKVHSVLEDLGLPAHLSPGLLEASLRKGYFTLRKQTENSAGPVLCNTDGERMEFCDLTFDLKIPLEDAFPRLASLCFAETPKDLLDQADRDKQGRIQKLDFPWLKKGNRRMKGWDNTVFANIVLTPGVLRLSVNSMERAQKAREEIAQRLGQDAVFLGQSLSSPMAPHEDDGPKASPTLTAKDIEADPALKSKLEDFAQRHWASWFDEKIPFLRNQTPRKAAKTDEGRALLESLLMDYERSNAMHPENPLKADIPWLKRELGLR